MSFPVNSPDIPYLGCLDGGLSSGTTVQISGSVPAEVSRFFLNLQCGDADGSAIALHFNPRFQDWETVVVCNTLDGSGWGGEERPSDMPFNRGESFELLITVTDSGYQINVNGTDFYTFSHRIPVDQVNTLVIGGDVVVDSINVM